MIDPHIFSEPSYWRDFFDSLASQFSNHWLRAWLLVPPVAGVMALLIRFALPRWRKLYVAVCVFGLIACAPLMWTPTGVVGGLTDLGCAMLMLGLLAAAAIGHQSANA